MKMLNINKKGFAIVIIMIIAAVTLSIIMAITIPVINEVRMVERMGDSVQAFYAAESGINKALWSLKQAYEGDTDWTSTDWISAGWSITPGEDFTDTNGNGWYDGDAGETYTDANGNGQYDGDTYTYGSAASPQSFVGADDDSTTVYCAVTMDMTDPENPTAVSTGYSPTTAGASKSVEAEFTMTSTGDANPDAVTNIITAGGTFSSGGDATIVGETESGTSLSEDLFESIFGMTKDEMRALTTVIQDPENNYTPVAGITWFELVNNEQVMMSSEDEEGNPMDPPWSGSGIMIVNGYLKITGESTFDGIIWVIGDCDLDLVGEAVINGAIFVEGNADIRGSATITYDEGDINDAIVDLPGGAAVYAINTWKEISP